MTRLVLIHRCFCNIKTIVFFDNTVKKHSQDGLKLFFTKLLTSEFLRCIFAATYKHHKL